MKNVRKPRADAKLKTLPKKRREEIVNHLQDHTLEETCAWLAEAKLKTSKAALMEFRRWSKLEERFETARGLFAQMLAFVAKFRGKNFADELSKAGQLFFTAKAIEEEDALAWKRAETVRLRAELVEIARQYARRNYLAELIKVAKCDKAAAILGSDEPDPDKMDKLGRHIFGDVWD